MERRAGADQDADVRARCQLRRRPCPGLWHPWAEDLFAPADEDSRYTTDVEAYPRRTARVDGEHLPKRGTIVEVNEWGQPKLPPKAERV